MTRYGSQSTDEMRGLAEEPPSHFIAAVDSDGQDTQVPVWVLESNVSLDGADSVSAWVEGVASDDAPFTNVDTIERDARRLLAAVAWHRRVASATLNSGLKVAQRVSDAGVGRWWVSWFEAGPFTYHGPWWVTGQEATEGGRHIYCAAVLADSSPAAMDVIVEAHDARPALDWRFVQHRGDDWSPFSDRFPRSSWMRWQGAA